MGLGHPFNNSHPHLCEPPSTPSFLLIPLHFSRIAFDKQKQDRTKQQSGLVFPAKRQPTVSFLAIHHFDFHRAYRFHQLVRLSSYWYWVRPSIRHHVARRFVNPKFTALEIDFPAPLPQLLLTNLIINRQHRISQRRQDCDPARNWKSRTTQSPP